MSALTYRDAVTADGPALDAMARQSWIDTFAHSCSPEDLALFLAEAYGPAGLLIRDLADPAIGFHLALAGEMIAGYAKVNAPWLPDDVAGPDTLQLSQLYVAQPWQGQGVAETLMAWARDQAAARGAHAIVLTVWEENARALAFYRRHGFEHVGEYAFRTGNQVDTDLVLRLTL